MRDKCVTFIGKKETYINNHNFIDRKCTDCPLEISYEIMEEVLEKQKAKSEANIEKGE